MKPPGRPALAFLPCLLLSVSACGDSPGDGRQAEAPAGAGGLHACDLLSPEEAAAALEATLKASERPAANPVARSSECRYEAEEIDGPGNHAFYSASQLFVFDGDHKLVLTLGMPGRPAAQRRERATEIARKAVSRLPGGSG